MFFNDKYIFLVIDGKVYIFFEFGWNDGESFVVVGRFFVWVWVFLFGFYVNNFWKLFSFWRVFIFVLRFVGVRVYMNFRREIFERDFFVFIAFSLNGGFAWGYFCRFIVFAFVVKVVFISFRGLRNLKMVYKVYFLEIDCGRISR